MVNKGQIWTGTTKYVEDKLVDIHDVEVIEISNPIVTYKRIDNGKVNRDIIDSFIINFNLNIEKSRDKNINSVLK